MNKTETFGEQQERGVRPHLSIQTMVIDREGIRPVCIFDIRRCKVYKSDSPKYQELAAKYLGE